MGKSALDLRIGAAACGSVVPGEIPGLSTTKPILVTALRAIPRA
jgi:hypothetical protein